MTEYINEEIYKKMKLVYARKDIDGMADVNPEHFKKIIASNMIEK